MAGLEGERVGCRGEAVGRQHDLWQLVASLQARIADVLQRQLSLQQGADIAFGILLNEGFHGLLQLSFRDVEVSRSELRVSLVVVCTADAHGSQLVGIAFHLDFFAGVAEDDELAEVGEHDVEGRFLGERRAPVETAFLHVERIYFIQSAIETINEEIGLLYVADFALDAEGVGVVAGR